MKKKFLLLPIVAAALSFTACSENELEFDIPSVDQPVNIETRAQFAEDDGSKVLSGAAQVNAKNLLKKVPADYIKEMTDTLGRADITPEQYAEIQAFAQELTAGLATNKAKYDACFKWITSNIKYGYVYPSGAPVDNNPYPVFTTKYAVCQGYANLLFIMMHSLDIPAFVCNGIVNLPDLFGGHAWNYVYCDKKWYVSDPTNGGSWLIDATSSYPHLQPSSFDVVLSKDNGVWINLNEYQLNVCHVEKADDVFVVPFSANGYQITSFNPSMPLPANVKQVNLGKNITTLGENYLGLAHYAPNLEYVEVDPENTTFTGYLGTVYRKNGNEFQLTFIPAGMKCIELMPMETIYKNTVYDHPGAEVLIVAPRTKKIEAWGIEKCPNLKIAYVPKDVEIDKNAFADVHSSFLIIRGDYTNIPEIRED